MRIWLALIVGGCITYLIRASFIALGTSWEMPAWFKRMLPFVAPAVFAAMVAPAVLGSSGLSGLSSPRPEVWAAAMAAAVAARTRSVGLALATGMIALWVINFAVG